MNICDAYNLLQMNSGVKRQTLPNESDYTSAVRDKGKDQVI